MHVPDRLGIGPAEGREVVTTLEDRPGSGHRVHVQVGPHPERRALPERAPRPVPDGVAVLPVPRRVAGVEAPGCSSDIANRNVRWQQPVQGPGQLGRRESPRVGEGDHLPRRMDSGVRSARAIDGLPDPSRESGQRLLQRSLDGPGTSLGLEPGELRAIVFNRRAEARRGALSSASTSCRCYSPLSRARCKAPSSVGRERTPTCVSAEARAATPQRAGSAATIRPARAGPSRRRRPSAGRS